MKTDMDRRIFIHTTAVAVASLLIPWLQACRSGSSTILDRPAFLSTIIDEQAILDIGRSYCSTFPTERDARILEERLLQGFSGKSEKYSEALENFFNEQIKADFNNGQDRIVVVGGWVLSVTEARQCALYSLVHQ